jgi:hypothetical protein
VTVPRASQRPRESWVATYQSHCTTALESQHIKTQKGYTGTGCWPHPWVRSLSRGGPEGHCRYPEDRVPPRTSSKSRQKTRRVRVATCPKALAPASRLGVAPGPPRVPVAPTPASRLGVAPGPLRVPVAPAPASWLGAALRPPRVAWAPAPSFWLRAALKLTHVPRTSSTSCKQINKYPLVTRSS